MHSHKITAFLKSCYEMTTSNLLNSGEVTQKKSLMTQNDKIIGKDVEYGSNDLTNHSSANSQNPNKPVPEGVLKDTNFIKQS